jgi:hypothetical protein
MATVVNTTSPGTSDSSGGLGFLFGIIALIIFLLLFWYYGLPLITRGGQSPQVIAPSQTQVEAPDNAPAAPTIDIPDQVDVDVNAPQPQQSPQ